VTEYVEQPPAEHTTNDPWPDGQVAPDEAYKLKALAIAHGWEVRMGYSRGYEKRGRGKVGGEGSARWVLRHFVGVQCRPPGAALPLRTRVVLGQDVEPEGQPWDRPSVWVDGYLSGILAFRKRIKAGP
jgi:hypothetical protein